MFASEVVRGWEIALLQSDDRVRGDRRLRPVGENSYYRNPRAGKAGVFAFPRGDELTIEKHSGDSIMAFCCIVAIVYEFSHIISLR